MIYTSLVKYMTNIYRIGRSFLDIESESHPPHTHVNMKVFQKASSKKPCKEDDAYLFGTIKQCGDKLLVSRIRDVETGVYAPAHMCIPVCYMSECIRLMGWADEDRFWMKTCEHSELCEHCEYCGEAFDSCGSRRRTKEHLLPKCMGGTLIIYVCHSCNARRGNSLDDQHFLNFIRKKPITWQLAIERADKQKFKEYRIDHMYTDRLISAFADGDILMRKDKHLKVQVFQKAPSKKQIYFHEEEDDEHLFGTITQCGDRLKFSIIRDVETKEEKKAPFSLYVTKTLVTNIMRLLGWSNRTRFWLKYKFVVGDEEITMYADDLKTFISTCENIK